MSLIDELTQIEEAAKRECAGASSRDEVAALKIKYLGRKGALAQTLPRLKALTPEEKPRTGREANRVKSVLEELFSAKEKSCASAPRRAGEGPDLTMPGTAPPAGALHPLTQVIDEIYDIFSRLGFRVVAGPEMETEHYNFDALNIPPDHPSRFEAFDTFYLDNDKLLRSQTSTVQIHVMEKNRPPIKVIAPGKVYRPDATDATHLFMFHQIEGLMVDKNVSFADLKGVLLEFARAFFGPKIKIRFRPSFFPFTEPSAEMDIHVPGKGWMEILGAGMVHPHVLQAVKISPEAYTGFAFGMGVERIAMRRWGVPDLRFFYENDLRFLKQLA